MDALTSPSRSGLVAHRHIGAALARVAWSSLCLLPLALAIGRFYPAYIAPGDGVWYQYRSVALYPSDVFAAVTSFAWLAARATHWRPSRPRAFPLVVAAGLVALALASAVSAIGALDRVLALYVAAHWILLALFFFVVSDLLAAFPRRQLVAALSLVVIAEATLGAWQTITQSTAPAGMVFNGWPTEIGAGDAGASVAVFFSSDRWLRSYGTFPHPNILGIFLALSLAILLCRRDAPSRLGALAIAAALVGLSLSASRSALLATGLVFVTLLTSSHRIRDTARAVTNAIRVQPVAVAPVVLLLLVAAARLLSLNTLPERNSLETRRLYDDVAWEIVDRGAPVGAGNLVLAQQHHGFSAVLSDPAHDVFLISLAEVGAPGLVAWLVVFAGIVAVIWRRRQDPLGQRGPLVAVSALLPLLLFDHYLWTQPPGRTLFVLTLALLLEAGLRNDPPGDPAAPATASLG